MSTLNADEQALFGRGYLQCEKRALRVARRWGAKEPEEILNAAMLRVIRRAKRAEDPLPMPASEQAFEEQFLRAVRSIASSTVRVNDSVIAPVHANWCDAPPPVCRRKLPERLLSQDFEDVDDYHKSAAVDDFDGDEPLPLPKYRGPCWPKVDREQMQAELELIVAIVISQLSAMQRDVVRLQLAEVGREASASRLGISVKTYDIHWSRAKDRMRLLLFQGQWRFPDPGFADKREWPSDWNEIIRMKYIRRSNRNIARYAKRRAEWLAAFRAEQDANAADEGSRAA